MSAVLYRWGTILAFSLLVSISFVLYGITFDRVGAPPTSPSVVEFVTYGQRVLFDPFFVAGMVLALGGALARMFIFEQVGIAATALVSELTLVMSVGLAVIVFRSDLRRLDVLGMVLIVSGVYLVQRGGTG